MRSLRRPLLAAAATVLALSACGSDDADDAGDPIVSLARWSVSAPPTGTEFTIVVEVGSSSCNSLERVDVDESADTVTVEAFVTVSSDDICTDDLAIEEVAVTLDEPLGERALLGCRPVGDDEDPASFDCR